MLKRSVPFTPEPTTKKTSSHAKGIGASKKTREYHSPAIKTPLRNVIKEGEKHQVTEAQDNSPRPPLNDDVKERRLHRRALVERERNQKKSILSPATHSPKVVASPKVLAATSTILTRNEKPSYGTPLSPAATLLLGKNGAAPTNKTFTSTLMAAPAPKLTTEQRNKMFEEWMKIAADNKINAKNSWNVALIDYFSELTFLRDGDSINFQKASCTLDGCVKIYATRVDSVADETGRLLNGLIDAKRNNLLDDALGAEDGNDTALAKESTRISKRRPHKAVDTLAPSFEPLTMKNFDLEFAMDPLFRKTCAEFDDGNGQGFLCSRLAFTTDGKLLFDATDAPSFDSYGVEDDGSVEEFNDQIKSTLQELVQKINIADDLVISSSLMDWSYASHIDMSTKMGNRLTKNLTETLNRLAAMSMSVEQMEVDSSEDELDHKVSGPNELGPRNADGTTIEVGGMGAVISLPAYESLPALVDDFDYGIDDGEFVQGEPVVTVENSSLKPQFTTENIEESYSRAMPGETATTSFLSYFDNKIQRNWAGPEHWKINRPHLRRTAPLGASSEENIGTSGKSSRGTKREFILNFNGPYIEHTAIFQKVNPSSITLSRTTLEERNDRNNLLPEDLHFSSSALVQLFLKPTWKVGLRRKQVSRPTPSSSTMAPCENQEVDLPIELRPSFWATADTTEANSQPKDGINGETLYGYENIANDGECDGDYEFYDDYSPTFSMGGDSQHTLTNPAPGITYPGLVPVMRAPMLSSTNLAIAHARRAKQIDVQELKRILWQEIETITKPPKASSKGKLNTARFTELIEELPKSNISKDALQDVSVPYCFICLLHLANEHDLEIKAINDNDLVISR